MEGRFTIRASDKHGNACSLLPELRDAECYGFDVRLRFLGNALGKANEQAIALWPSRRKVGDVSEVGGRVTMLEEGTFEGTYNTTRAGEYELSVAHNGVPIGGSPFALRVLAGPTHLRNCVRLHEPDEAAALPPRAAARAARAARARLLWKRAARAATASPRSSAARRPPRAPCPTMATARMRSPTRRPSRASTWSR